MLKAEFQVILMVLYSACVSLYADCWYNMQLHLHYNAVRNLHNNVLI